MVSVCGVIGILGDFPLRMARDLLLLLTHRGQDAAGLLWNEMDSIRTSKAMGNPGKIEVPEVITPHIITCSKCGSQLELKVSSIASKNTEQFCPVCGEPAD